MTEERTKILNAFLHNCVRSIKKVDMINCKKVWIFLLLIAITFYVQRHWASVTAATSVELEIDRIFVCRQQCVNSVYFIDILEYVVVSQYVSYEYRLQLFWFADGWVDEGSIPIVISHFCKGISEPLVLSYRSTYPSLGQRIWRLPVRFSMYS